MGVSRCYQGYSRPQGAPSLRPLSHLYLRGCVQPLGKGLGEEFGHMLGDNDGYGEILGQALEHMLGGQGGSARGCAYGQHLVPHFLIGINGDGLLEDIELSSSGI